jgi:hypothetical protein
MACLKDTDNVKHQWDHDTKYHNTPGLIWTSDQQCQLLLRDPDAKTDHNEAQLPEICERLYCKSPSKVGYYASGPALEGIVLNRSILESGD